MRRRQGVIIPLFFQMVPTTSYLDGGGAWSLQLLLYGTNKLSMRPPRLLRSSLHQPTISRKFFSRRENCEDCLSRSTTFIRPPMETWMRNTRVNALVPNRGLTRSFDVLTHIPVQLGFESRGPVGTQKMSLRLGEMGGNKNFCEYEANIVFLSGSSIKK